MKILFLDTETTGVPVNYDAPATDMNNWPRMVQLGYILYDYNRNVIKEESFIIKPDNYIIPDDSSKIHRITTEIACNKGVDIKAALSKLETDLESVDLIVGHNIDFDINIVDCEFYRYFKKTFLGSFEKICTMRASTDFCGLPNNKWPKLEQLHFKLFKNNFTGAHDAMADITATAKCFWKLVDEGIIKMKNEDSINKNSLDVDSYIELSALGKIYFKLRQTHLDDTIESQLNFLSDFYASNDNNLLKTSLSKMQEMFINKEYSIFINEHEALFKKETSYDPTFSQLNLEGINDKQSVQRAIDAINIFISELEIPADLQKEIQIYVDKIKMKQDSSTNIKTGNSGCMLILPLILSGLTCMLFLIMKVFV